MLANPDIGVTQIAHRLGVSPATLYRYIPAANAAGEQLVPAAESVEDAVLNVGAAARGGLVGVER